MDKFKSKKHIGGRAITLMRRDFVDEETWLYLLLCHGVTEKERTRVDVIDMIPLQYKLKGRKLANIEKVKV